ncbi:MAG: NAD(P)-dependent oxidoreductase [bacterium]|nr:NAD(P)-dependent oxidoreductase [bacterium]
MTKIVVSEGLRLSPEQEKRLKALGNCAIYNEAAKSDEEALKRFKEADVICTESAPIENVIYSLKDKLVCFPFVGMGWLDLKKLDAKGVKVANAPGCNKSAVTEWVISMMIMAARELYSVINKPSDSYAGFPMETTGLASKNVTILGKGNIGKQVHGVCNALGMNVMVFSRGDDIKKSVENADFVINCLARNKETEGILDENFFGAMKERAYFISATSLQIYDIDALKKSLDIGKLSGAAIDLEGVKVGDSSDPLYKGLAKHPKILVTPHIAFNTDVSMKVGNDIMIDNAEAWINGRPINIVI